MTGTNGSASHSLTWYSCKNSLSPSGSHKMGETMPSPVLQTHPVESAAWLTTNSQSCCSHAHLASSICVTVCSIRALPGSTDQLVFPVYWENPTSASLFSPYYNLFLKSGSRSFLKSIIKVSIPTQTCKSCKHFVLVQISVIMNILLIIVFCTCPKCNITVICFHLLYMQLF